MPIVKITEPVLKTEQGSSVRSHGRLYSKPHSKILKLFKPNLPERIT